MALAIILLFSILIFFAQKAEGLSVDFENVHSVFGPQIKPLYVFWS
jgi:hypothetical protein